MTTNSKIKAIRRVVPGDADIVFDTLTLAFSADPYMRYLWPEPTEFISGFRLFARAISGKGFSHGSVFSISHLAVALWLPPGISPDPEAVANVVNNGFSGKKRNIVEAIVEHMTLLRPKGPHWYLPIIGVDSLIHGQGLGSSLLVHGLRKCDQEGRSAYLESSNEKNIRLYERHGFTIVDKIQIQDCPPLTTMIRLEKTYN